MEKTASLPAGVATSGDSQVLPASRIKSLDALKGIAILAVIFLHSPRHVESMSWPLQIFFQLCRFGVPYFFLTAGFFFMRGWNRNPNPVALARRYAIRLTIPFFFWALFYAVIPPFVGGAPNGIGPEVLHHLLNMIRYPHHLLLTGYVYHLWFLSSLIQVTAIVWIAMRFGGIHIALLVGGLLYGVALLGGPYSQTLFGFHTHFDMKNGPFVGTLFFALGAWLEPRRRNVPLAVGIVLLGIGLLTYLSEAAYLQSTFAQPMISNNYLLGSIPFSLGTVLIALARPNLGGIAAEVGVYSLGLYALHAYVIEVLMRLPYGRAFSDFPFLFSLLVFALSFAAIRLLSRIRWMRALIM